MRTHIRHVDTDMGMNTDIDMVADVDMVIDMGIDTNTMLT